MTNRIDLIAAVLTCLALGALPAAAQSSGTVPAAPQAPGAAPAPAQSAGTAAAAAPDDDPDLDLNKAQPDFALTTLPTTLRLPKHKMVFRMTHRFNDPIADAKIGGLWGMDSGAQIGLEFRYGLFRATQLGFSRTSDKTIEFFSQYDLLQQGRSKPLGLAATASVEGTNNFQDSYSPSVGLIVSREIGTRAAVYLEPRYVNNSNPLPTALTDHNSTGMLGFGARLRLLTSTYFVFEVNPRVGGFTKGTTLAAYGIEKRAGGHVFQLTISNGSGTTPAQVARGGPDGNHWYLGFNLSRKFY